MYVKKLPAKSWLQFEMPMQTIFKMMYGAEAGGHHQLPPKLGYKFSGSGHFDVYVEGIIESCGADNENIVYLWMPVIRM